MGKITHKRIAGSSSNSAMMKDGRLQGLLGNLTWQRKWGIERGCYTNLYVEVNSSFRSFTSCWVFPDDNWASIFFCPCIYRPGYALRLYVSVALRNCKDLSILEALTQFAYGPPKPRVARFELLKPLEPSSTASQRMRKLIFQNWSSLRFDKWIQQTRWVVLSLFCR